MVCIESRIFEQHPLAMNDSSSADKYDDYLHCYIFRVNVLHNNTIVCVVTFSK